MQSLKTEDIKVLTRALQREMEKNKQLLTELDGVMGDGDLGLTMTRAFEAAAEEAEQSDQVLPGKMMIRLGAVIAKAAPSTMGTLLATGFMRGGKALDVVTQLGPAELALFFDAFVKGMMERGKSAPGSKTIIDTLYPAARALEAAAAASEPLETAIGRAYVAASQGLSASTEMKAQHGRAAYYQEASIGRQDGGATVGFLLVVGFYQMISKS